MKVDADHRVSLKLPGGTSSGLDRLHVGSEVAAKVVIRHGADDAVLEIMGKRIRARFARGVPADSDITLRLEKSTHSSLLFKIVSRQNTLTPKEAILPHLLSMTRPDLQQLRSSLGRLTGAGISSIFLLNAHLLGIDPKAPGTRSPVSLLMKMMASGMSMESLRQIASLHILGSLPPSLALLALGIFFGDRQKKWLRSGRGDDAQDLSTIIEEIDTIADQEHGADAIRGLIDLLASPNPSSQHPIHGGFCLCEDDVLSEARYIMNDHSILIDLHLSQLGQLEILAREDASGITVRLYGDTAEHLNRLEQHITDLQESLQEVMKPVTIHLCIKSDIINKIVEIITQYALNSAIDITV